MVRGRNRAERCRTRRRSAVPRVVRRDPTFRDPRRRRLHGPARRVGGRARVPRGPRHPVGAPGSAHDRGPPRRVRRVSQHGCGALVGRRHPPRPAHRGRRDRGGGRPGPGRDRARAHPGLVRDPRPAQLRRHPRPHGRRRTRVREPRRRAPVRLHRRRPDPPGHARVRPSRRPRGGPALDGHRGHGRRAPPGRPDPCPQGRRRIRSVRVRSQLDAGRPHRARHRDQRARRHGPARGRDRTP